MSSNDQGDLFHDLPALPYAGASGFSGSDTSEARAKREDASGITSERQREILRFLAVARAEGATWHQISDRFGIHHGSASGALSALHKAGRIARLVEVRSRSKIYVLPSFVNGRAVEEYQPNARKVRVPEGMVAVMLPRSIVEEIVERRLGLDGWTPGEAFTLRSASRTALEEQA